LIRKSHWKSNNARRSTRRNRCS